ncbi:ABC transporter substrate-binding protein [Kribbella sp. NPDC050820]|uniref:ABC transporter substrate-binding protein n=1 Tax=Kribbella sp. NPDC050820 TaxID=3155408 RepID=UPI0033F8A5F0
MRTRFATLTAGLAAMAILAACGSEADQPGTAAAGATADATAGAFPMTIDNCGRDVTFDSPPQRIVTVGSVAAPLVAAAGAADRIVVRTFETASFPGEYGPALDGIEIVAPSAELAREEIIARTPDLVISYQGAATTADDLAAAGIPLIASRGYCQDAAGDYEDIFADIELYGRLFGTTKAASAQVRALRKRVSAVQEQVPADAPSRTAAALIVSRDDTSLSAYGNTSTIDKQMETLGLTNAFDDINQRNFEASIEALIDRDPQVLILLTQGDQTPHSVEQAILSRPELRSLAAVRDHRIVIVPFGYTGPGPVAVQGLEVLADKLNALG